MYTLEDFKAWVSAKEEGTVIGESYSICNCPLANFYKAMDTKYDKISVAKMEKGWFSGREIVKEPNSPWEITFITRIDNLKKSRFLPITREEVLHALV